MCLYKKRVSCTTISLALSLSPFNKRHPHIFFVVNNSTEECKIIISKSPLVAPFTHFISLFLLFSLLQQEEIRMNFGQNLKIGYTHLTQYVTVFRFANIPWKISGKCFTLQRFGWILISLENCLKSCRA